MGARERRTDLFGQLAVVGKAFASPKRLEIIDLLTQGERTVDSVAREIGLGVSTASAHLQILKLSNLVRTRRDGTHIHYSLAGENVASLYAAMNVVALVHSADVGRALDAYLGVQGIGEVEEMSRSELVQRLEAGDVVVLDVRPAEEYATGHIASALSVPFGELEERLDSLPDDVDVVAYCRGAYCVMAHDAVRLLHSHGRDARRLEDGMLEWRLAGNPVATGG